MKNLLFDKLEKIQRSDHYNIYFALKKEDTQRFLVKELTSGDASRLYNEIKIHQEVYQDSKAHIILLNENPAFVRTYIEGVCVRELLAKGAIPLAHFYDLSLAIVEAVAHFHNLNLLHRDLNPNNLLYHAESNSVKIIDFDLSTYLNFKESGAGSFEHPEGTLAYISPEQTGRTNRRIDYRSDYYSLGATFYEMLVGQLPFVSQEPLSLIHDHLATAPTPPHQLNPAIPTVLSEIIIKLLQKNAEDRYQSLEGLQSDLALCAQHLRENQPDKWFEVGQMDNHGRFLLSQQIFGREKELEHLEHCYQATRLGERRFIALCGATGVGKTALIHRFHESVSHQQNLILRGQFDPFQRQVPYFAWVQAFDGFVSWVLSTSKEEQATWKSAFASSLNGLEGLLTELVPSLSLLWGKTISPSELTGSERQNSLDFAINAFVKCLGKAAYPLLLLIEDWQWADEASVRLLYGLITNEDLTYNLTIITYRDGDANINPEFEKLLSSATNLYPTKNQQVNLQNLKEESVTQLLAQSLRLSEDTVHPLSLVIYSKTQGNAFAVNNLIRDIYEQKMLFYNFTQNCWQWNIEPIRQRYVNEDVADLIIARLTQNDTPLLPSLKTAAAIGVEFGLTEVAALEQRSEADIHHEWWPLIQDGWLLPNEPNYRYIPEFYSEQKISIYFTFAHARIQQAIYAQTSPSETLSLHYRIGKQQLDSYQEGTPTDGLFTLAGHLSLGYSLFKNPTDLEKIARVFKQTGEKAYYNAAFGIALEYFEKVLKSPHNQLPSASFADFYATLIKCAQLAGNEALSEHYAQTALSLFDTFGERSLIYEAHVKSYIWSGKMKEAVAVCQQALVELGVKIPSKSSTVQIILNAISTNIRLPDSKVNTIDQWPMVNDEKVLVTVRLLNTALTPYFFANRASYPILIFKIVQFSIKHGICPEAMVGFSSYALVTAGVLKKPERGVLLGEKVLQLLERFPSDQMKAVISFIDGMFISHWTKDWRHIIASTQEGYKSSLRTGNMEYASWNRFLLVQIHVLMGNDWLKNHQLLQELVSFQKQYQQLNQLNVAILILRYVEQVAGVKPVLSASYPSNEVILEQLKESDDSVMICSYYFFQLFYLVGTEDWEQAWENSQKAWGYRDALAGTFLMGELAFYGIFSAIQYARQFPQEATAKLKKTVKEMLAVLKHCTKLNPITQVVLYDFALVEARELLHLSTSPKATYSSIFKTALQYDFHFIAALIATRNGIELTKQNSAQAENWFKQAEELYKSQNANAIAQFVRRNHLKVTQSVSASTTLDAATLVKIATSISSEIKLDRLLAQLMRYAIENAGAERGVFILVRNGQFMVELELTKTQHSDFKLVRQALEDSPLVAQSIINYARSTASASVIGNASTQPPFQQDPYVIAHQTKSVLCLPFLYQNALKGLLYLENNLSTDIFTPQRVELLTLLAGQVAVAIENAIMYENLENLVEQRTRQLEEEKRVSDSLLRNILPEQIANELKEKGHSDAQYYENVTVLFADIQNFSKFAEIQTPAKLVEEIDFYFRAFDAIISNYPIEKIKTIGDAYFCVGGLPAPNQTHASDIILAALDMQEWIEKESAKRLQQGKTALQLRVGIHTGPVVAGVVGSIKFAYDIWGDTVNIAARMEQNGVIGKVNVSEATYQLIKNDYACEYRGEIQAKNKGLLKMYFVQKP